MNEFQSSTFYTGVAFGKTTSENFGSNNRGESVKRFRGLPVNTINISKFSS